MIEPKKLLIAMLFVFTSLTAISQNQSADKKKAVFSFNDGETIYALYQTKIVPPYKHKISVLDEPIIDTLRDPEDLSIILAIDTLIGQEFRYARKYSYSYDILSQEYQNILAMAKDQGFDVVQTKFIIFWEEGVYAQFRLPASVDLDGTTKVCLTISLQKNGSRMDYPVFFEE